MPIILITKRGSFWWVEVAGLEVAGYGFRLEAIHAANKLLGKDSWDIDEVAA